MSPKILITYNPALQSHLSAISILLSIKYHLRTRPRSAVSYQDSTRNEKGNFE